jgi:predicted TIM-barrel fold metal-dependent hydrolase
MLSQMTGATVAAFAFPNSRPLPASNDSVSTPERKKPLVWDVHCHFSGVTGTPEERIDRLLYFADRMKVDRLILFMGTSWSGDPSPDRLRQENDEVLRAVEHSQGRAFGFVYLNPKHVEESLDELDRCVHDGPMVGIKLWIALECSHNNLDPILRRAAELKAPVLQHAYMRTNGNLPGESSPLDVAALARRHPTVPIIAAHTGNDWERGIRAIRQTENVFAEICGSDPTAGMVEMAVRELGAERVMYGSDIGGRSFASQLAKVQGADISGRDKQLILGGNVERVLQPIFDAKGIKL